MIKFIGALLLLISGTLIGFMQAAKIAERPRQLRQLIHMLQRLLTEISYGQTLLPDALLRAAGTSKGPVQHLIKKAGEQLGESGGEHTFEQVWSDAINEYWAHTAMKTTEKTVLLRLGSSLGISDIADQAKHIQLATDQLKLEEESSREDQRRYEAMWKSLGVLAAVLLIILMM